MSDPKAISVTRLVRRMRNLLEIELGEVWVEGEISNIRKQSSGHQYFTLKDAGGQIPCVLFRGNASKVNFDLEDGLKVLVFAEASLYEARGQVQLIVRKVELQGEGDLQKKFEQLKAKLAAEGLFDQDRKKQIPSYPQRVGLVTSPSAAALQDMLNVLERRAPWVQPVLYPVQVQGAGAEVGIAAAIREWNDNKELPEVDVLIVGRGGGSIEDLWNFNEEVVARAIAESEIPVISAVGHEIDFTIADFVADMRAPTPSAAIEIAVPDGEDLQRRMEVYKSVIERAVDQRIQQMQLVLNSLKQGLLAKSPDALLRESLLKLESLSMSMDHEVDGKIEHWTQQVALLKQRLHAQRPEDAIDALLDKLRRYREDMDRLVESRLEKAGEKLHQLGQMHRALGPDTAFSRGFSLTTNAEGEIVNSVESLSGGDKLTTRFTDGTVESVVIDE